MEIGHDMNDYDLGGIFDDFIASVSRRHTCPNNDSKALLVTVYDMNTSGQDKVFDHSLDPHETQSVFAWRRGCPPKATEVTVEIMHPRRATYVLTYVL